MKRTDIDALSPLQLELFLRYSRFLVRLYRLKHEAHAWLGVYPLRRKFIIKLLRTRIHLTVSVDTRPRYHWVESAEIPPST